MTKQQVANQIVKYLRSNNGYSLTRDLIKMFGNQTNEALNLLGRRIIRVRGVGAFVELCD